MTLYTAVDEVVLNWNDYIYSNTNPLNSPVVMQLAALTEQAGAATGQLVVVYDKLGSGAVNATFELRQGYTSESSLGTLIKTSTVTNATGGTATISLSAVEYDTIVFTAGSASNLFVRILAHAPSDSGVFVQTAASGNLLRGGHSNGAAADGTITSAPGGTAGTRYWWTVTAEDIGSGNVTVRLYRDTTLLASATKPAFTGAVDRIAFANLFGGGRSRGVDMTIFAARAYDRYFPDTEIAQLGVLDIPSPPTANAGEDKVASEGATVTLDGSASSDLITPFENLVWSWTVTNAGGTTLTTGQLAGANTPVVSFTAPNVTGSATVTLQLQVTNQVALSSTDTVTVTVTDAMPVMWPHVPLPITTELLLGGVWTSIDKVDVDAGIVNVTGRSDWAGQVDAGEARLTLHNTDGRFSSRNPFSPYYGLLTRNTRIRSSIMHDVAYRRFVKEVASWPLEWDASGVQVLAPITASGILRRLSQSVPAVKSVLKRQIPRVLGNLVGYWPLEDQPGRRKIASGLSDGDAMRVLSAASPNLASYDGFAASAPILTLNDADIRGNVEHYTFTSGAAQVQLGFLLHVGDNGSTAGQTIIHLEQSGTAAQWEIRYEAPAAGGVLQVRCKNRDGVEIVNSGDLHSSVNGDDCLMILRLKKEGTLVRWELYKLLAGQDVGVEFQGALSGDYSLGRCERVVVNYGGGHSDVSIGHVTVQSAAQNFKDLARALRAYEGETAGRRIQRLCSEHNQPFRSKGDLDATERMGPQRVGALLELIRDAADADAGMLYEPRDVFAVGYRTRESLYNQTPTLTLNYQSQVLSVPLTPVEDDQDLRNDVTASGPLGEARAVLSSGPLSIQDPPNGVGVYEDQVDCNCEAERFQDAAAWRLRLGTIDEARYPTIKVEMGNPNIIMDMALMRAVMNVDIGDRIVITNPPAWLPPEPISVLVQGYTEEYSPFRHDITWNCSPESPYQVGVVGSARVDTAGSTLTAQVSQGASSMSVATPSGFLWTTTAGDFPIVVMVAGIRVTVTNITGTSSPQTFSVSGVTKVLPSGSKVELADPARTGL